MNQFTEVVVTVFQNYLRLLLLLIKFSKIHLINRLSKKLEISNNEFNDKFEYFKRF